MRDFVVGICYGPLDQKEKAFFGNLTFTGPCLHGGASTHQYLLEGQHRRAQRIQKDSGMH